MPPRDRLAFASRLAASSRASWRAGWGGFDGALCDDCSFFGRKIAAASLGLARFGGHAR